MILRWLNYLLLTLMFSSVCYAQEDVQNLIRNSINFTGQKILDVETIGNGFSDQLKLKLNAIKGKEYRPQISRQLIEWYHQNDGDYQLELFAEPVRGGIKILARIKERLKIDSINFEGNYTSTSNMLSSLIDLKEESEFDKASVEEAVKKISNFYTTQGYLSSDVKYSFDPKNRNLTFIVREGEPTLISELIFSKLNVIEDKLLRERYEREIAERFGMKKGDRIQRDKVMEGIQAVKDWLREHDFLTAKDPTLEYKVSEDGKVKLILNIQSGPRIRYGFQGNHKFSYRELMLMVGEVKEVSGGNDYLGSVRRRVLEAYKEIGFNNAQITTLVREDPAKGIRYVSLVVNEGDKIRIVALNIYGIQSMSEDAARDKFNSLATRLVQRHFFHESGINKAAELFAEYLKSQGYLSAKLEFSKFDFNDDKTKVSVSLMFSEGTQTFVQEVKINGLKTFTTKEVMDELKLEVGKPFDIFAFEKGLVDFKEKYQDVGNLNAQIVNEGAENFVKYNKDNSQVFIQIDVEEGPLFRVGEIIVRGHQQTHSKVVSRELPFITGDILTRPLLTESEENLKQLNLFSSVIVKPIDRPGEDNVKDILILVEEATPGYFEVAPGFRNDLGLRLGMGVGYQNLGGWNRSIGTRAVFNRRLGAEASRANLKSDNAYRTFKHTSLFEYNFSVGFKEPYLAGWPVTFTSDLDLIKRIYPSFNAEISKLTLGVRRKFTNIYSGFVEYGYEKAKFSNIRNDTYLDSPNGIVSTKLIGSVTPGIVIDSRNDHFNPSRGFYSVNRFELASRFFGSAADIGYTRSTSDNSAYINLGDGFVLAMAMNMGFERSTVQNKEIPFYKLFRLGGLGSIRGYAESDIEVESQKNVNGILGLINYRAELRAPIGSNLGAAFFMDAGNLMLDRLAFAPKRMRSSTGAGLRYITPVGPVVLDFAWRLQSDTVVGDTTVGGTNAMSSDRQDRYKIHFAIGAF